MGFVNQALGHLQKEQELSRRGARDILYPEQELSSRGTRDTLQQEQELSRRGVRQNQMTQVSKVQILQGWEFNFWFIMQIARFLTKKSKLL